MKILKTIGINLLGVHGGGVMIAMTWFEYQYWEEHSLLDGFLTGLLFGFIVPALKAIVWEYFLISSFMSGAIG